MRFLITIITVCCTLGSQAQTTLSGVINHYAMATAFDTCSGRLTISDTTGFRPQGKVLIYHAQGAAFNTTNTNQYGTLTALNTAGRYEYALIDSVNTNAVYLKNRLLYPVSASARVQAVTVVMAENATIADTIKAMPWNGQTGGIIALEVSGTLTLNAPIDASGTGFRGGASYVSSINNCTWVIGETGYFYASGNWRGGLKGEGAGGILTGQELGRGRAINGGGGGNDHNSGGGGGANVANGGLGGENADPSLFTCDGLYPGVGGGGLTNSAGRLFFGGGGGAGHTNNGYDSDGGAGGGLVLVSAGTIAGSNKTIHANGRNGEISAGDGSGGGGAGGSIWLNISNPVPGLIVQANGGKGGNSLNGNADRCFGPGGGGAGGRIVSNLSNIPAPTGGVAGVVANSTANCNGTTNGAQAGNNGQSEAYSTIPTGTQPVGIPSILTAPQPVLACMGDPVSFMAQVSANATQLQWQINTGNGWTNLPGATQSIFNTTATTNGVLYRLVARNGNCGEVISDAASLTVLPSPTGQFTVTTLDYNSFQFNGVVDNAFGGFFWNFGDGISSTMLAPTHTYAGEGDYEVQLIVWNGCDTVVVQQQVSVLAAPQAIFAVPFNLTACGETLLEFDNQSTGTNTSFLWQFPGGNPASSTLAEPSVTYTISGNYTATLTATNAAGSSTASQSFTVEIIDFPNADFSLLDLPGSVVQFTNLSVGAGTVTWDFGDGSPLSMAENPVHVYPEAGGSFVVRLTISNPCGTSVLEQTIDVDPAGVSTTEQQLRQLVQLVPNPTTGLVRVVSILPVGQVTVWSADGRQLSVATTPGQSVNLNGNPAGLYWIGVEVEGKMVVKPVVLVD